MRLRILGEDGEGRLARAVAFTFLGAMAILALSFGRDVLIPMAVAVLFAFILNPVVNGLRRVLPLPLAVGLAMLGAMACIGVLAVLVTSQLAEVAGSLAGYQTNLHQKIQDVRQLSEGAGPVSRFIAMTASLAQDVSPEAGTATPALRVQSGESNLASIASFVAPLLHPLLSVGIVIVLALFILLDRDKLSDKIVRLFGADVHATSQAVGDAAARIARMLSLQLLTNLGFAVLVGTGLFALGMPNALLWGLLAGAFRFVPYVGAILGALLPTLIALAVMPGWLQPLLVLALIVALDILTGQLVEPLLFGESTGITPLALILSAIFWGMLWGPIGLLLSTPLTICLLVLGTHVPALQFLRVLLGDEPALSPHQQIYRRLIRGAVVDAAAVARKEIEDKGLERGLDESLGRMMVLADEDREMHRLNATQTATIVDGTDEVLDLLAESIGEEAAPDPERAPGVAKGADGVLVHCVGGRGEVDDAAAAVVAFGLRQRGLEAEDSRRGEPIDESRHKGPVLLVVCYCSHPSQAVLRYNKRKLHEGVGLTRHVVIDYEVAPMTDLAAKVGLAGDLVAGNLDAIFRFVLQQTTAATVATAG
ncbi:AI-2E family transporter [Reyranella sp.]|uniref:AI-2E family transporter n=1 Tax=Reyranella sp. TaxID=1929291 RepID=UPI003D0CF239